MNRRTLLLASGLLPLGALAQQGPRVDVVKVMSFSCPACYAAEAQDRAIEAVVAQGNGRFVRAPLPSLEGDTGDKDRVYYAARDISPRMTEDVKVSLYKAFHEMRISLNDLMSTYNWLEQDLAHVDTTVLRNLVQRAQEPAAAAAFKRAVTLAKQAGVDRVPSYIVLVDSEVVATLDPSLFPQGLAALREAVIARVQQAQQKSATHVR